MNWFTFSTMVVIGVVAYFTVAGISALLVRRSPSVMVSGFALIVVALAIIGTDLVTRPNDVFLGFLAGAVAGPIIRAAFPRFSSALPVRRS